MENNPQLFLYRHKDRNFIINKMNNLDWEANDASKDLNKQDKYSLEQLQAMRLVAKMKESADRMGAGFVGGFISPTGERFMMSNVEVDDVQHQAIKMRLDQLQAEMNDDIDELMEEQWSLLLPSGVSLALRASSFLQFSKRFDCVVGLN